MKKGKKQGEEPSVAPVVERNIRALLAHREKMARSMTWNEKLAMAVSRFAATQFFLLTHVIVIGGWILSNSSLFPRAPKFDPSLVGLAVAVSVEAIFLSAFILMTQRRMMKDADDRADLNLQISLLAEYEVTRLLTLTRAVARKLDVEEADHPELEELEKDVAPEVVLETINKHEQIIQSEK